jgi:hypothetical protein
MVGNLGKHFQKKGRGIVQEKGPFSIRQMIGMGAVLFVSSFPVVHSFLFTREDGQFLRNDYLERIYSLDRKIGTLEKKIDSLILMLGRFRSKDLFED